MIFKRVLAMGLFVHVDGILACPHSHKRQA